MKIDELIDHIKQQAREAGACDKLTGSEDLDGLARLVMSPAGMEFCIQNRFPAGYTWRQLRENEDMERYGIYIDAGEVMLEDPENVLLVGRTTANITCTGKGRRNIYGLRGCSIILNAYDWTVCRVIADTSCHSIKQPHGNAVII